MSVFRSTSQRDFNEDDEEDDNDENKASDFVSFRTDKDEVEQLLADAEDRHGFHTVRKEVVKPHKPLVGVEFDPAWNKKIGAVEKTPKPPQQDEDSPAEEVDSEPEDYIDHASPRSWIEEVDFECESEVTSDPESEYDAPPDFESDSDSDAQDDKPASSNPVDACMTRMTLSQNVTIEYPDRYHVDPIRAVTWSQEKRAAELRDITLRFMEKMCTDIYLLVDKRDRKKVLVFDQSDEAVVTFSVKVNKDEKDVGYRYEARIKNKSNWVTRMAYCKGDEIKFHATEVESFYIVKIPIKETEIIQPEGNTLSFKHSGGVSMDMPSQTVEMPQPIAMQLSNVDKRAMVKRHSLFPEKFKLQKVSQRLYVQHDIEKFNKAFSVKLDLESFRDTDAGPLEPVAILWNDGEPTIKSKAECSLSQEANRVVMTMKNFPNRSGLSVGLVAPGKMNQDEAKLAYADVFMCKITIHIKIVNPQEATVYINCIMIENLPSLLDQYKPLWLIGISEDFYLKNFQRIRIHLSGNSIRKRSSRQKVLNCFIVFSNRARENCLSFRIDKDTRMGGCPNTVLDFSLDSGSKRKLHRQEFDPWMLVGRKPGCLDKSSVFTLSKGQTFVGLKTPRPL
ncbi:uncharacterized protein [Magallana gigas]|uniref:uncharacterized protein isoform X2 n=1 Tax=Magallana gigas TaxID=29159 RepID=UPI00333ECBF0